MSHTPGGPAARCPQRARVPEPRQRKAAPGLALPGQRAALPTQGLPWVQGTLLSPSWGGGTIPGDRGTLRALLAPTTGCPTHHQSPMMLAGQRRMKKSPSWVREEGSILPGLRGAPSPLRAPRGDPGSRARRRPEGPAGAPAGGCPLPPSAGPGRAGTAAGGAGLGWGWAGQAPPGGWSAARRLLRRRRRRRDGAAKASASDRETGARGDGQGGPGGGTPGCQARLQARSHGRGVGTATGTLRQRDGGCSLPGPASRRRARTRAPYSGVWLAQPCPPEPRGPGTALPGTAPPGTAGLSPAALTGACLAQPCLAPLGVLVQPCQTQPLSRSPPGTCRSLSCLTLTPLARPCPNLAPPSCCPRSPAWPLSLLGHLAQAWLHCPACPRTHLSCLGTLEK